MKLPTNVYVFRTTFCEKQPNQMCVVILVLNNWKHDTTRTRGRHEIPKALQFDAFLPASISLKSLGFFCGNTAVFSDKKTIDTSIEHFSFSSATNLESVLFAARISQVCTWRQEQMWMIPGKQFGNASFVKSRHKIPDSTFRFFVSVHGKQRKSRNPLFNACFVAERCWVRGEMKNLYDTRVKRWWKDRIMIAAFFVVSMRVFGLFKNSLEYCSSFSLLLGSFWFISAPSSLQLDRKTAKNAPCLSIHCSSLATLRLHGFLFKIPQSEFFAWVAPKSCTCWEDWFCMGLCLASLSEVLRSLMY